MSAGPSSGHCNFSTARGPRHPFRAIRTATSTLTKPSMLEAIAGRAKPRQTLAARPWRLNCSGARVPRHVSRSPIGIVIAAAGAFVLNPASEGCRVLLFIASDGCSADLRRRANNDGRSGRSHIGLQSGLLMT
jgi:hypothetical protein